MNLIRNTPAVPGSVWRKFIGRSPATEDQERTHKVGPEPRQALIGTVQIATHSFINPVRGFVIDCSPALAFSCFGDPKWQPLGTEGVRQSNVIPVPVLALAILAEI